MTIDAKPKDNGYTHWTGKPTDPSTHELVLVPQSVSDGWSAHCSCGVWGSFASFYDIDGREPLMAHLRAQHAHHVDPSVIVPEPAPSEWRKQADQIGVEKPKQSRSLNEVLGELRK